MDLVRPGAVGFGLCLAGSLLAVVIAFPLASAMGLENGALLAALSGVIVFAVLQAATVRPDVEGEWIARALNLVLPPAAALLGLRLFGRAR
ncbi:MAG: hypothetical protein M3343_07575 [Actinomycetota bacterium]|nr:hypothetical protein [Actinomycetota bacterium]